MFQNFIVLGLIPGTHIQINFDDWLILASVVALWITIWPIIRLSIYRLIVAHRLTFIVLTLLFENHQSV